MGALPSLTLKIDPEGCAAIHTGGILPEGADAVLMLEDAEPAGEFVEARRALQRGENVIGQGEEFLKGDFILRAGASLGFAEVGLLAAVGVREAPVPVVQIGILSTGDEVQALGEPLPPGRVRDVNGWALQSLLRQKGYPHLRHYGVCGDHWDTLRAMFLEMTERCDVLLISGGSSVSQRDYTQRLLETLSGGSLLVRGLRMSPGKPTLVAGSRQEKKLALGLPGHPLSCLVAAWTFLLPLLSALITRSAGSSGSTGSTGSTGKPWHQVRLPLLGDVWGHAGGETFVPCALRDGKAKPLFAKSGYVGALRGLSGLIRLPENTDTLRAGEEAEVLLW
jgi:molybdopterin molybdotransferase